MAMRLRSAVFVLLLLLAAACVGYLSQRHAWMSDWTAGGRASLSAPSRAVLARLKGPVKVVSYASPGSDLRPTIATFMARYRRIKPDITLSFVDPQTDPAAMRKAGISVDGELVIHYHGREQRLDQLSEHSMTNALLRLARGGDRIVAFVTGDGERRADGKGNADLGTFISQLEQGGVRAVPLNFSQVTAVPQDTDLVVLASPMAPLSPGAVKALVDYVHDGGNLLWLAEPDAGDLGLAPLARVLGVTVLPGMLVDGSGAAMGLSDPRLIAVGSYPDDPITHGFVMTTLFPQVAALAQTSDTQWAVHPLLRSSAQSWTLSAAAGTGKPASAQYDPSGGGLKGPLAFGFALSRLSPSPRHNQQRVVVIGDGDFLSNSYLGNGGNRALGERVFNWLLGDDALVNLPSRAAPDRVLRLSQTGLNALTGTFLVALPLLLLLAGLWIGWRRRRR